MQEAILTCVALLISLTGQSCLSSNIPPKTEAEHGVSANANNTNRDLSIHTDDLVIGQTSNQPVRVVDVKFDKTKLTDGPGNILLTIKNVGDKPIAAIRYWLSPPPCLQYKMPAQHIDYGDKSLLSQSKVGRPCDPLLPGQSTTLSFTHPRIIEYLAGKGRATCSPDDKPVIFLVTVVFANGEIWDMTKPANGY